MKGIENFDIILTHVKARLSGLQPDLYYHSIDHTLSVLKESEAIALQEAIFTSDEILLLKIAALYHDCGFLTTYEGHETESCRMARNDLPTFGMNEEDIEIICSLIMSTRLPQSPVSKLEQVICDADLDYLGRDDFFTISEKFFKELRVRNIVLDKQEWNKLQVRFLTQHRYFTNTNITRRNQKKSENIEQVIALGKEGV